jgi:dTDP-4-amino-4,6-dideoxygalactose transaminase
MNIPFNCPHFTGREAHNATMVGIYGKLSRNGVFTRKCHTLFETRYKFHKVLLTTSCTDALEMAALLADITPGDEVIMPSFTFVSTANAFVLRGAKIVFADCQSNSPNIDPESLPSLITSNTRAIVVVHYAGIACDMDRIMAIANEYKLLVIEDAAHAIDSFYRDRPLVSIGHFATFSFHETKNIISGEGGMLVINDERFVKRAEIVWEKGTNRAAFYRGEVPKYDWVDIGSSFLPSEITAAFLYGQLESIDDIQTKRKQIWEWYFEAFKPLADAGYIELLFVPAFASQNGHLFYFLTRNREQRDAFIGHMNKRDIQAVFHYLPLHSSPYFYDRHDGRPLPNSDRFADCIVRLPFYYDLREEQVSEIAAVAMKFFSE